ncbi:MAG: hypothetical protein QG564_1020 [Campylobacterota bacterium]|nr:hypothetical protein [Campylobacterota bacterium]
MNRVNIKHLGAIGVISSMLFFSGCTPEEQAFASGAAVGAVAGTIIGSYDSPRYYDRPYYYYGGRYYYGGHYRNGYYHYKGRRLHGGHYYHRYDRRHHRDHRDRRDHRR